jgi:hypothetical protein
MGLLAQFAGSIMILAAYAASQLRWIGTQSWSYLLLNLVGSGILAADVWLNRQWGFVPLEVAWAAVSLWGMARKAAGRPA